jgi:uncharacterized protein YprB with RNaseH-like and TPR domain
MLETIRLDRIIFLDIETVSSKKHYKELTPKWKKLWDKKASFIIKGEEKPKEIYSKAGIYAEFGKIICISVGLYRKTGKKVEFRIKSFYGDDEKRVLQDFCALLTKYFESPNYLLCAHNGKEFDFPFLARRILVNRITLPYLLDIAGRKPWEVQHIDTLQLWKFGDYKHYTSLDLLTQLFGVDSPKIDMDGSDVGRVYWEEDNLEKIVKYCENDVIAIAQLLLAYKGNVSIKKKEINIVS